MEWNNATDTVLHGKRRAQRQCHTAGVHCTVYDCGPTELGHNDSSNCREQEAGENAREKSSSSPDLKQTRRQKRRSAVCCRFQVARGEHEGSASTKTGASLKVGIMVGLAKAARERRVVGREGEAGWILAASGSTGEGVVAPLQVGAAHDRVHHTRGQHQPHHPPLHAPAPLAGAPSPSPLLCPLTLALPGRCGTTTALPLPGLPLYGPRSR